MSIDLFDSLKIELNVRKAISDYDVTRYKGREIHSSYFWTLYKSMDDEHFILKSNLKRSALKVIECQNEEVATLILRNALIFISVDKEILVYAHLSKLEAAQYGVKCRETLHSSSSFNACLDHADRCVVRKNQDVEVFLNLETALMLNDELFGYLY